MSDIIDLQKERAKRTTLTTHRASDKTRKHCMHAAVSVGDDFGEVECAGCGVQLSAHEVLLGYARKERSFIFTERHAIDTVAKLKANIAELKAEERRVKARLSRARKALASLPPEVVIQAAPDAGEETA